MLVETKVVIENKTGFHVRVAGDFAELAARFSADVMVSSDAHTADGKSMIDLIQLNAPPGSVIRLRIEGDDAEEAMRSLVQFLKDPDAFAPRAAAARKGSK